MLALIPGFLLKFLGSGVIDSVLAHQRKKLESANELERIKLEGSIRGLEIEQQRRETIAKLQALEYQHWALWWPKLLIGFSVASYVAASFAAKTLNLTADYNIIVPSLDIWQQGVAGVVTGYYFLKS
jgi:hypothetical protein